MDAYYHRRQAKDGQQPQMSVLSMLPKGYSLYADGAVKDVKRDQRLSAAHEAEVFEYAGVPQFTEHDLRPEAVERISRLG